MQNDFIDGSLGTKEAQGIVTSVAEKIRNFEGDIYGTLDTRKESSSETLHLRRRWMGIKQRSHAGNRRDKSGSSQFL